ncbi:MAG: chemotaxis protein CheD [bacterium]|nr:chemotaxis protein CheD [bacterium]
MATIRVNMAQLAVVKSPDNIETRALGSCVGIVLYENYAKLGGLAHAMLPDGNNMKESLRNNPAKFVNSSIDMLLTQIIKLGADKRFIKAKIAGGANMFPNIIRDNSLSIGKRNVDAAKKKLKELEIPLIAEETGGSIGRTIILDTSTGKLKIRSIVHGVKEI